MKVKYLFIIFFLIIRNNYSQIGVVKDTLKMDDIYNSVVMIKESIKSNRLGSGFLISHKNKYYLVTAEHVMKFTNSESYITIGKYNENATNVYIRNLIDKKLLAIWQTHQNADLSVLQLSDKKGILSKYKEHFIDSKNIVSSKADSTISASSGFYTVGFPLGYGVYPKFEPLTKHSNLASNKIHVRNSKDIYGKNDVFNNKKLIHILLEEPSVGGFSGGPVYFPGGAFGLRFITHSIHPKISGIVSGTIGDNTGGKMAVITPSYLIFDLVKNE